MIVIASSPLLSYLSYEIMASDGWLEGYFIGTLSSHGRVEEGIISSDELMPTIRITSFNRVGCHSPTIFSSNSLPDNAVGWFRYRNNSTNRISLRETAAHFRISRDVSNFVFCLATRELKGDVQLTMALNFSFYTVNPAEGPGRKISVQPIQLMIANPDDAVQPAYPFYQIEHAFSVPWLVPEENQSNGSPKHRNSFHRAVGHSMPINAPLTDPSQLLVDYSKDSYKSMIDRLAEISAKLQRHESLINFE